MDIKIFQYRNLLPPNVSEAGRFLLCVMAFVNVPFGDGAIRRILKTVACDDIVPRVLRDLEDERLLDCVHTASLGSFYALTATAISYLDIHDEHTPHRSVRIMPSAYKTYRIKSEIAADALVALAADVYTAAWNGLTEEERRHYLDKKNLDPRKLDKALAARDVSSIDALPRSLVSTRDVSIAVADGISRGAVPFTPHHRTALYASVDKPLLHAMECYDAAIHYKMKLAASRKSPRGMSSAFHARRYLELTHELEELNAEIEKLKPKCTVFTYRHGEKALCLSTLDTNGILIRSISESLLNVSILNNASPNGLTGDTLARRIDICVSLADALGLAPVITIHSLPTDRLYTARRLSAALDKLGLSYMPEIKWLVLPESKPKPKYAVMNGISKQSNL